MPEIEDRLRLARRALPAPSPEAEERALRAALAEVPHERAARGRLRRALAVRGRRRIALGLAVLLPVVVAVVAWTATSGGPESPRLLVVSGGAGRFPAESFTDWVSYADQVSVVSVAAEEARPAEVIEPGDESIMRVVTLRIERTVWRRREAPTAGRTVRVLTYGWAVRDGERRPVAGWGGPRLEVGRRYVTPLVRAPRDGVDWTPLAVESVLPLDGDEIVTTGIAGAPSTIARRMAGRSVDDLSAVLAGTRPDPVAASHFDLPPDQRVKAVQGG
jgi:hypothetical protein